MINQSIKIESYKHNDKIHRTWTETTILTVKPDIIGVNERCKVIEANGNVWVTKVPAVVVFPKGKWFNIVGMLNPERHSYYCNIISPIEKTESGIRYVDYDIDLVYERGMIRVLDEEEYVYHKKIWGYSQNIEANVKTAVTEIKQWMSAEEGPFAPGFINFWYNKYKVVKGEIR